MKMFSAHALVALLLGLSATGCVFIPIPTPHYESGYARTNINHHAPEQFVKGITTREDIIMTLGEPDAVSWDEGQLAYRSEKVEAVWIWAMIIGPYSLGAGAIYKNHFFVFEFDPQGRFQSVRQTGQWGMADMTDEPQLRSPRFKSNGSNGSPSTIAGEPIQREYLKSYWLAGVDGFRANGSLAFRGQPGHLFLTESNLAFVTESEFANADPDLKLAFASMSQVHVDTFFISRRRLVVRLKTGEAHSFDFGSPGSVFHDRPGKPGICDFIQSKIKPNSSKP